MKIVHVPTERSKTARLARFLGTLSLPVLALTALASHFNLVPPQALFPAIATGVGLGLAGALLAVMSLMAVWVNGSEGANHAFAALFRAIPALVLIGLVLYAIKTYPMVHDVSTSPDFPPEFLLLGDDETFEGQETGPELAERIGLAGRLYPVDAARVFSDITLLVAENDWVVADMIEPTDGFNGGRIEAVAKTPIFAFRDIVAIRIAEEPDGTRVDMRSATQHVRHDLGQNSRRIRKFLTELDTSLQGERTLLGGSVDEDGNVLEGTPVPKPQPSS